MYKLRRYSLGDMRWDDMMWDDMMWDDMTDDDKEKYWKKKERMRDRSESFSPLTLPMLTHIQLQA